MKKKILIMVLVLLASFQTINAQTVNSSYTYGQAKFHSHMAEYSYIGYYCGRWLVNDSANNGGNNFLGNMICVEDINTNVETWFWYDWSADNDPVFKQATWDKHITVIQITFDDECMFAFTAEKYVELPPPPPPCENC